MTTRFAFLTLNRFCEFVGLENEWPARSIVMVPPPVTPTRLNALSSSSAHISIVASVILTALLTAPPSEA